MKEPEDFLETLDLMIESTQEFIADDRIDPRDDPEGRYADLTALEHVRQLYIDAFQPTED